MKKDMRLFSMHQYFGFLALLLCFFILWALFVWIADMPHYILPGPDLVLVALFSHMDLLIEHSLVTIFEIIAGFVIGLAFGLNTGLQLISSQRARDWLLPFMIVCQAIPIFALAPILILWLGYGVIAKIIIIALMIYFPISVTFFEGLKRTPSGYLDLAKVMGASARIQLYRTRIPYALPYLAPGIKLAGIYAPIGAIMGEWAGASKGLGYLMLHANGLLKIDLLFACVLILAAFTLCFYGLISVVMNRFTYWAAISVQ